jgi:biopolymer transport protein ExbD
VVSITGPPVSQTFFEDEQVTPAALRTKLAAQKGLKRTVVIKADRRAPIEDVTAVLTIALELGYPAVIATAEGR